MAQHPYFRRLLSYLINMHIADFDLCTIMQIKLRNAEMWAREKERGRLKRGREKELERAPERGSDRGGG